jgi:hypothetical protein
MSHLVNWPPSTISAELGVSALSLISSDRQTSLCIKTSMQSTEPTPARPDKAALRPLAGARGVLVRIISECRLWSPTWRAGHAQASDRHRPGR